MSITAAVTENPFRPGAGTKPLYLAGRTKEQSAFTTALGRTSVSQNLIITGLRGVGKTVLLDQFKPVANKNGWLWAGNDWTEAAAIAEKDVATRLLVDLTACLSPFVSYSEQNPAIGFKTDSEIKQRPLNYNDLSGIYESTPGFVSDKLKAVLLYVASIITNFGIKGIVFAYDEAQILSDKRTKDQYPLSLVVDLFSNIQKHDLGCQFLLVLTGLPTLITNLNEARTYTERMFHTLMLDRLSDQETRDAVVKPIEISVSPLTFAENTIERIVEESRGYPFLIQYICREVFDAWIGKIAVGEAPSVPMDEITAKLDLDFFAPRWNRATDRQQTFMQVIAMLDNSDAEFTIQEVSTESRRVLVKPFTPSHGTQMMGHLAEKGLIYRTKRGSYCFAVPLLAAFINRQSKDDSTFSLLD